MHLRDHIIIRNVLLMGAIGLIIPTACHPGSGSKEEEYNWSESPTKEEPTIPPEQKEPKHKLVGIGKGVIEANRIVPVYSRLALLVTESKVREGNQVRKGDLLFTLDPEEKEDQVRQCEVSLREKELALREILIGQGFSWEDTARIPKQKIEFARIKSGYTSAFLQSELALKEMRKTRIEAPVSGFIYDLKIHPNDYAKTTEPCCYIVNTDQLNVVFYMLEQEVDKLKVGKRISVTPVAYDHQTFPATITRILPIVDENGMIKVKARLERPEDLLPGMNVIVNL